MTGYIGEGSAQVVYNAPQGEHTALKQAAARQSGTYSEMLRALVLLGLRQVDPMAAVQVEKAREDYYR